VGGEGEKATPGNDHDNHGGGLEEGVCGQLGQFRGHKVGGS